MPRQNPSRPTTSPLKVTHHGGDPHQFRHEIARASDEAVTPPKRVKQFKSTKEFQESKMESAVIDENLQRAINNDLKSRNLR